MIKDRTVATRPCKLWPLNPKVFSLVICLISLIANYKLSPVPTITLQNKLNNKLSIFFYTLTMVTNKYPFTSLNRPHL